MPILSLYKIQKEYKDHSVIKDVDLIIDQNEVFGLIGLNGSGKTSLLKCLLDLHKVTAGHIQIFKHSHLDKKARKQLVYLPEKFLPPEYMNGQEYLQWISDSYQLKLDNKSFASRIDTLLSKMDLDKGALKKLVKDFSKGMTQKLGIIGCLLSEKELLVLDEPMSGLDPKARVLFKNIVLELKQAGKTVFLCTHILSDIEQLCDKIGILHNGRLLFVGSPAQCCRQYQSESLEQAFLKAIG